MKRTNTPPSIQLGVTALMCLCLAYLMIFGPAKVSAREAQSLAETYYTALKEEDWRTFASLFKPNAAIQVRADYGGAAEPDGYDTTASKWESVAHMSGGGWGYAVEGSGLNERNWQFTPGKARIDADGTQIRIDHRSDYNFQGYQGQASGYETLTLHRYYGYPVITALESYKHFGE